MLQDFRFVIHSATSTKERRGTARDMWTETYVRVICKVQTKDSRRNDSMHHVYPFGTRQFHNSPVLTEEPSRYHSLRPHVNKKILFPQQQGRCDVPESGTTPPTTNPPDDSTLTYRCCGVSVSDLGSIALQTSIVKTLRRVIWSSIQKVSMFVAGWVTQRVAKGETFQKLCMGF